MERVCIVGLGYVGLPLALAISRKFPGTVGFDVNASKISDLISGIDRTSYASESLLKTALIQFSANPNDLKLCTCFIVAVPTPVDRHKRPDLAPLLSASEIVGKSMANGALVIYESTVYPGVTEEICAPTLERASGLPRTQFRVGYSPERINPGDKEHTLERIVKLVAGEDRQTTDRVAAIYETIISAGVYRATSIKVAEAAKVIENTQRDLNIALMNELALIFDRMNINTKDVLEAASTKWNFLRFTPGLVGGHCIGVDPYYLTTKAEELGYHPQVILAGRRINDGMGAFLAQKTVKLCVRAGLPIKGARIGILGVTFKENVSDIRNSRVPDIVSELTEFGALPIVHDPHADREETNKEYGIELSDIESLVDLDALILAVAHNDFTTTDALTDLVARVRENGVIVDVKSVIDRRKLRASITLWSL
jgi:UDP-N-acetyl-D-glucosamine/UDP-N-acetyl-D-galactosamine dehydrogenase